MPYPCGRLLKNGPALMALFTGTMAAMTGQAVAEAAIRRASVLLPIGVIEAHGPHLPTGTDALIATQLCRLTQLYARRELLIAPPFVWGVNGILGQFAGSFDIRPETAAMLLTDVVQSLLGNGFTEILLVSHHGDLAHNRMVLGVLQSFHARGHTGVRWLYTPARPNMIARLGMTGQEPVWVFWEPTPELDRFRMTGTLGVHADEVETAAIVRYFPETVDFHALRGLPPTQLDAAGLAEWRTGGEAARRLTPNGYFGDPNPVDPDLWRLFDETARIMAAALDTEEAG